MKSLFAGLLLLAAIAASGCGATGMSASVTLRSAPPPPAIEFGSEPHFNRLAGFNLSVIADDTFGYDMFQSGGSYYLYSGGYWYRAPQPRGPFVVVETRRVPKQIFDVDDSKYHWRAHPEGWRGGRQAGGDDRHPHGDDHGGNH